MMQANQSCSVETRSLTIFARARKRLYALLFAATMPALSVSVADAGTEAGKDPQSLVVSAAICHTAPARNNPRKLAGVAEVFRGINLQTSSVVLRSTGTAFAAPQTFSQNDGGFSVMHRWSSGDFDGDGDQDLIAVWNNGGTTALAIRRSNGTSFVTSHLFIPAVAWSADTIWVPGDFDNDGDADLAAVIHDGSSTSIDVYTFTGLFGTPTRRMTAGLPWSSNTKWSVGDFNADGKDDLVSVADGGGIAWSVAWLSYGAGFTGFTWSLVGGWSNTTSYVAGDFTGDGKADLAGIWDSSGYVAIAVYVSSGSAFLYPSHWMSSSQLFNSDDRWVAGKLNDDDRVDLAQAWDNDGVSYRSAVLTNATGTAFSYSFGAYAGTSAWKNEASICAGVFNAQ